MRRWERDEMGVLSITEIINTVKKHMKNIYEKLGTSSRMELVYIINQKKK